LDTSSTTLLNAVKSSLDKASTAFKPLTLLNNVDSFLIFPPVAVLTSFSTPSNPFDFIAAALNSIPSFFANDSASEDGSIIDVIAALNPVTASSVFIPLVVNAEIDPNNSFMLILADAPIDATLPIELDNSAIVVFPLTCAAKNLSEITFASSAENEYAFIR
jgi:hypothetical protein